MQDLSVSFDDGILRVIIDRPQKHNALSRDTLREIGSVFAHWAADERVRVAVLRGAGEASFAAGGDLRDLAQVRSHQQARDMAELGRRSFDRIRQFPVPVIAAINGNALGGGAELALACDYRVAAAHARIGFIQRQLAIPTAWGGGIDLMRRLGPGAGLRLLCRGEILGATEALALGLVDGVAGERQTLDEAVAEAADDFRRAPRQVVCAYKALARGLQAGWGSDDLGELETDMLARAWVHDDHWAAAENALRKDRKSS